MILMLLLSAIVIDPLTFIVAWRWPRRRRVLAAVGAVALFWVAMIASLIMVTGPPVFGSQTVPPLVPLMIVMQQVFEKDTVDDPCASGVRSRASLPRPGA
jgi:hypothetical protein